MQKHTHRSWIPRVVLPILAVTLVSGQQTQKPTFRAETNLIRTEVIVRDNSGRFIPGLDVKEFELYEDGVLQTINNFVTVIGGRALTTMAAPTAAPVQSEGLILPPAPPPPDQSGRVFIIFIDDFHFLHSDTPKVRDLMKKIRDTLLHDGDLIAMVSTGHSSVEVNLTYDLKHRRFNEAMSKVAGSGMSYQEILAANQTMEGPAGLRHNAFVAFSTAYDMLGQASQIKDRRKAFIYISSGYDFNPFTQSRYKAAQDKYARSDEQQRPGQAGSDTTMSVDDVARHQNPFETNGQQFAEADLVSALAELTRTARRSNVTFYTMDPRGLIAGPDITMNVAVEEWRSFVQTTTSSLRILGDETGGFCICDRNDFIPGLKKIDNEMSDYYVVGYVSSNPDPLKVRRTIEIKVKRPAARDVIYNKQYTIKR